MDIKKAIVLAGGLGTRLRPLTYKTPKPLIPVHGKTLTEHVFDILKKFNVKEVFLSLCYKAEEIKRYFGDGSRFNLKINYLIEKEPMGTAGPLLLKRINETFIMLNGDNLFNLDLEKMFELHKKNKAVATIALTQVKDVTRFGVVKLEGDKITAFVEKPKKEQAPSHWISTGYYILEPGVFYFLPKKKFVMMERDVFPEIANKGRLFGYKDPGQWFDTGDLQKYEQVKREWRDIQ